MKKKICFVVPRAWYLFDPEAKDIIDKVGGAQKQVYLLSTLLAESGKHDVHFIVADFGQTLKVCIKNVTIWKSFSFNDNFIKRAFRFIQTLSKVSADVYVFRAADFTVALSIFYIRCFLQKKVIYMLASQKEISFKAHRKENGFLTTASMFLAYKKASTIIAQTKEQFDFFYKNTGRKPSGIVKSLIDEKEISRNQGDLRKYTLWVGRLDPIKNPELFIQLASKYQDQKFQMICPPAMEHQKYANSFYKKCRIPENLEIIPFVHPEKMGDYYRNAMVYVMTSESEGFSNTMIEAMAAACPVLSYKINPENLFEKYSPGYFANGNIELFYSYLEKLISDPDLARQMGMNGQKYLFENHSSGNILKEFEVLLDQFV